MLLLKMKTVLGGARSERWLAAIAGLVCLGLVLLPADAAQARRYASLVIDAKSGQVLHQENADRQVYPASLTKMMTLYMVFEALERGELSPTQKLGVSKRAAGMPPSKLGLRAGDSIEVGDAILALVTKSANDVAVVIAEALGGTESGFANLMTRRARTLGMAHTTFRNASGLPNDRQVTTARDMAKLARQLLIEYPEYYRYFATEHFTYRGRVYRNHNRLLSSYDGTDGIKTGYIRASGFNLVASVKRGNRRLIAVVFGGKSARSRDRHMAGLLDDGFKTVMSAGVRKLLPPPLRKPVQVARASAVGTAAAEETVSDVVVPRERPDAEVIVPRPKPKVAELEAQGDGSGDRDAEPARGTGRWAIQVGAYYRYDPAEQAARRAAEKFPELLGETRIWVTHIKGRRGKIYRSRLVGLEEDAARAACKRLKAARVDCMVLKVRRGASLAARGASIGEAPAN